MYKRQIILEIGVEDQEKIPVEIGRIPIMVKSKYCNLYGLSQEELIAHYEDPADYGGYFIINGNERILVMIEDLAANQVFIEKNDQLTLKFFSQRRQSYRVPSQITEAKNGLLQIEFSRFRGIPVVLLIKALGLTRDADISKLIGIESDTLLINLYEYASITREDEALVKIAELMNLQGTKKEKQDKVELRIDSALFPHLGNDKKARLNKALLLCKLVKHYLIAKENKLETDRDHYMNKRVRLSGELLADLFRVNFAVFIRDLQHNLQKMEKKRGFYSLRGIAKSTLFSRRIESAIATGLWTAQRTGVTQNIDKTNCLAVLSRLQYVVSSLPSEQENFRARALHPTHYGRFCPIETPEGTSIGLRKNLALLCRVSTWIDLDKYKVKEKLKQIGLKEFKLK